MDHPPAAAAGKTEASAAFEAAQKENRGNVRRLEHLLDHVVTGEASGPLPSAKLAVARDLYAGTLAV